MPRPPITRAAAAMYLAVAGLTVAMFASCDSGSRADRDHQQPVSTTSATTTSAVPRATTTSIVVTATDAELLDRLVVAPESSDEGYERALFQPAGWTDADGDGCDVRAEVLIRDSLRPPTTTPGCTVVQGDWTSSYENYNTPDPTELEIDHVVALAEAWRSGAAGWPEVQRVAFAQDEANLLSVTAAMNRSKGDRDPAKWQPPNRGAWCAMGRRWIATKVTWGLTADEAEAKALRVFLGTC